MMSRRRSFFITSVVLSAVVLFGVAAAQAQQTPVSPVLATVGDPVAFDKLKVTWGAGADGNPLDLTSGYRVYYMKVDDDSTTALDADDIPNSRSMDVSRNKTKDEQTLTLTGLTAETTYAVGVAAKNTDGEVIVTAFAATAPTQLETGEAPSPSTPRNVRAMGGDETFTLMWDAPFAGHSSLEIKQYHVQKREVAGTLTGDWVPSTPKTVAGDETMIVFKDLDNGTTYEGRVQAENDAGKKSGWTTRDGDDPDDDATAMVGGDDMEDDDMEDEDDEDMPMETPALPIVGILLLGAGLVAAGRRRLQQ
jgi:hypothetical protein